MAAGITAFLCVQLFAQGGTWTTKAPMPTPRGSTVGGVVDGILYVVGSLFVVGIGTVGVVQAYDPKTNTWTTKAPMLTPRSNAAAGVVDGILYVVGGLTNSGIVATVEAYDPRTNVWTPKASMPTPRIGLAAGVINGILYAVGGYCDDEPKYLATVEAYDPKTNTWTTKAPLPTRRIFHGAGVIDGILYAAGGFNNQGVPGLDVATLEAYDPETNTWTAKAPMNAPRHNLAVAVADGILYAIGGERFNSSPPRVSQATVEAYDPKNNTWAFQSPMPTPRAFLAAGVVAGILYAVGGYRDELSLTLAVNEAFTPFLPVSIDIKPGERANTINLKSRGIVQVAILSSPTFDASTVNPDTITLADASVTTTGKGTPITAVRDVDRDGRLDLVVQFHTEDLQLTSTSTEAVLKGTTFSGVRIRGADSIRIVPQP